METSERGLEEQSREVSEMLRELLEVPRSGGLNLSEGVGSSEGAESH